MIQQEKYPAEQLIDTASIANDSRASKCFISSSVLQGLPLGSGMGSSAASAAAGAWAVNNLFGCPLSKQELVPAGLASEAAVSGYHADNIAPALMGGFVLIRQGTQGSSIPGNAVLRPHNCSNSS